MNTFSAQKVRTCIATYKNMYGVIPGIQEMMDWSGESYEVVRSVYETEIQGNLFMAA